MNVCTQSSALRLNPFKPLKAKSETKIRIEMKSLLIITVIPFIVCCADTIESYLYHPGGSRSFMKQKLLFTLLQDSRYLVHYPPIFSGFVAL
jgi:hypothetical protein